MRSAAEPALESRTQRRIPIPPRLNLSSAISLTAAAIALLFLVVPLLALTLRAVDTRAWDYTAASPIPAAIRLSLETTAAASLITLIFGTPLAYWLAQRRSNLRRVITVLVELPVVLPPAVAGIALLVTFGRSGLFGPALTAIDAVPTFTRYAVILAQVFVAAPFYIRAAQIGFQAIPREIMDAARVDGAGGWRLFRGVTVPLARRSLSAGLILCWARAMGEFGATVIFAGNTQNRTQTLTMLVYNYFQRDLRASIWAGLILIALAMVALLVSQWMASRGEVD
jgi:molybdate transport system permease protein